MTHGTEIPTLTDIEDSKKAMDDIQSFLFSTDLSFVDSKGVTRITIKGLEDSYLMTAINNGVWASLQIFTAVNQFMVFSGIAYKPKNTTTLPYIVGATPDLLFVEVVGNLSTAQGDSRYDRKLTLDQAKSDLVLLVGQTIRITDRADGLFDVISGILTADTYGIVQHDMLPISLSLRIVGSRLTLLHFGALGNSDGTAGVGNNDTGAIVAMHMATGYVYAPQNYKFRMTVPVPEIINGVWLGDSQSDSGVNSGPSMIVFDDEFLTITDKMITHPRIIKSLQFRGTSKNCTGLAIENVVVNKFLGWTRYEDVRVIGCGRNVHIGNVFNCVISNLIAELGVEGVIVDPFNDAGDNGYVTTLNFHNLVTRAHDDIGLNFDPAKKSPNITFTGKTNIESNCSVSGTAQAKFKNMEPFVIDHLYVEGNLDVECVEWIAGNVGAVEGGYQNKCGNMQFGTGTEDIRFTDYKITATGGKIEAGGGSNQRLSWTNSTIFFESGIPSLGSLSFTDTTVDGTYYSTRKKGTSVDFQMNSVSDQGIFGITGISLAFTGKTINANDVELLVPDTFLGDIMKNTVAIAKIRGQWLQDIRLEVHAQGGTSDGNYYRITAHNSHPVTNHVIVDGTIDITFFRIS